MAALRRGWRTPLEHVRIWRRGAEKYIASWRSSDEENEIIRADRVAAEKERVNMDEQRRAMRGMGADVREMRDNIDFKLLLEKRVKLLKETVRAFAVGYREGLGGFRSNDKPK